MSSNNLFKAILISVTFITTVIILIQYKNVIVQSEINRSTYLSNSNKTKYIQYECKSSLCGGWSDRLDGIISALALALIQNRKLLISITQPCLINNLLEPNIIKWDTKLTNINKLNTYNLYSIDDFKLIAKMETIDLKNYLKDYELINVRNNQNWLKSFSINPTISEDIKNLGYNQSEFRTQFIFKEWYKALFKLKPNMEEKYAGFLIKANKSNRNNKLVCAQIRLGGSNRKNHASDWKFNDRNSTKLIWDFIRKEFLSKLVGDNIYKIFVTTDDEDVQKEALDEFGVNNLIVNSGSIVHIDRDVHDLDNDCSMIEKTILDFHCLQNCDMAVISDSGFGKMGLWNREKPSENLYLFTSNKFLKFNQSEFFYKS